MKWRKGRKYEIFAQNQFYKEQKKQRTSRSTPETSKRTDEEQAVILHKAIYIRCYFSNYFGVFVCNFLFQFLFDALC